MDKKRTDKSPFGSKYPSEAATRNDMDKGINVPEEKSCSKSEKKKIAVYAISALVLCVCVAGATISIWASKKDDVTDVKPDSGTSTDADAGNTGSGSGSNAPDESEGGSGSENPDYEEGSGNVRDKIIGMIGGITGGNSSNSNPSEYDYKAYTVKSNWLEQGDLLMSRFRGDDINLSSTEDSLSHVVTFGSEDDLAKFVESRGEVFDLGGGNPDGYFAGNSKLWNDEFFKKNVVLIAYRTSSNGNKASIKDVTRSSSTLSINLKINNSGMSTAVMTGYFVVVEIDRKCLKGINSCAVLPDGIATGRSGSSRLG